MNCTCSQYPPIPFDRKSINKRIRQTKTILPSLELIAENPELCLKLLKCPSCGQSWQTGHEWGFQDKEYVFQVPDIEVVEWLQEPYAQPAAMMIYTTRMQDYFEANSFETGTNPCRVEGCEEKAIKSGAFCLQHHLTQLEKVGLLPKRPPGRRFSPYSEPV